ncbi:hypothetical protein BDA96_05G111900 [Sorghum bicolor]|uniref:XPG N-terminal domain-containing protein n=2 Tax=Sorghum bicolor TaxID=4558 RepID=A0A921UG34_SORBI|nr:hypothetical protein BDA96_05G111900 [Sorghum bicolor]KXG28297.1 hypothetical protein SORBI_3005G107200 [Sorghum bicolor]
MVDNRVDANPRRMLARSLLLSPIGGRTKPDLAARGSGTHSGAPGHAHCGGLTKLLAEHAPRAAAQRRVEDYRGRVIAVDASLSIYQFLVQR